MRFNDSIYNIFASEVGIKNPSQSELNMQAELREECENLNICITEGLDALGDMLTRIGLYCDDEEGIDRCTVMKLGGFIQAQSYMLKCTLRVTETPANQNSKEV